MRGLDPGCGWAAWGLPRERASERLSHRCFLTWPEEARNQPHRDVGLLGVARTNGSGKSRASPHTSDLCKPAAHLGRGQGTPHFGKAKKKNQKPKSLTKGPGVRVPALQTLSSLSKVLEAFIIVILLVFLKNKNKHTLYCSVLLLDVPAG